MTMAWQKLSVFIGNCRVEHCVRKASGKCRATGHVFEKVRSVSGYRGPSSHHSGLCHQYLWDFKCWLNVGAHLRPRMSIKPVYEHSAGQD